MGRVAIFSLIAVILLVSLVVVFSRRRGTESTQNNAVAPYGRNEPASFKEFYKPYADYLDASPDHITALVDKLAASTHLPRHDETYPIARETVRATAKAFESAVREQYGVAISVDDADPGQLDRLVNAHLIEPELRPYFDGIVLRENLDDVASEKYAQLVDAHRIPNEPLLYYAMGAFWGEWMVRHRLAQWTLYEPLRPVQAFPDMITAVQTICHQPFSQVVKKMSDPEGDQLAYKAHVGSSQRYIPPYPLLASIADSNEAVRSLLSQEGRAGVDQETAGNSSAAYDSFRKAIAKDPNNATLYSLGFQAAFRTEHYEDAFAWAKRACELEPNNPMLKHNFAIMIGGQPDGEAAAIKLLDEAVALDPQYARGRLTLAGFLSSTDPARAREQATWVKEHDEKLAGDAEELLQSLDNPQPAR
ncbi:MAG: tetratricopeptide repeat protein [Thermoanaerobaculia bacterium]